MGIVVDKITSKDNQQIKFVQSLHDKKTRKEAGLCIIEGKTILEDAISRNVEISKIFARENFAVEADVIANKCKSDVELFVVDEELMSKITTTDTAPPIIAIAKTKEFVDPIFDSASSIQASDIFLYCEDIQDPGNLGSIIRTAFAAGVKSIYLSPSSADIFNTKTIRSSMGTVFAGNINYIEISELLNKFQTKCQDEKLSCEILGTSSYSESSYNEIRVSQQKVFMLLVGNESRGLSKNAIDSCTQLVKIPMANNVESINVLAATSVVLFDLRHKLCQS